MPQEKTEFYFQAVRRYREQAAEAHRAGNPRLAASYLIEAARNLLQLAQHTTGPLREAQLAKARELRSLAARLADEPAGKPAASEHTVPEMDREPGSLLGCCPNAPRFPSTISWGSTT